MEQRNAVMHYKFFLSEVAYISFFADLPLQTFHHRE
jgi:hypothetical protein